MNNPEKIIEDLKRAQRLVWDTKEQHCNIMDNDDALTVRYAIFDAISILEPVPPVQDGNGALICGNQTLGCGVVGMYDVETEKVTEKISNYCAFCGKKVKWDG